MLSRTARRAGQEGGFTLIELLTVILIIGILAAIAIPTFIGQRFKAQDSLAKSDARNLVTQVESCAAGVSVYTDCDSLAELTNSGSQPIGLDYGAGAGQVEVASGAADGYDAVAHSRSGTTFTIERRGSPTYTRTCDQPGEGACPSSGLW